MSDDELERKLAELAKRKGKKPKAKPKKETNWKYIQKQIKLIEELLQEEDETAEIISEVEDTDPDSTDNGYVTIETILEIKEISQILTENYSGFRVSQVDSGVKITFTNKFKKKRKTF